MGEQVGLKLWVKAGVFPDVPKSAKVVFVQAHAQTHFFVQRPATRGGPLRGARRFGPQHDAPIFNLAPALGRVFRSMQGSPDPPPPPSQATYALPAGEREKAEEPVDSASNEDAEQSPEDMEENEAEAENPTPSSAKVKHAEHHASVLRDAMKVRPGHQPHSAPGVPPTRRCCVQAIASGGWSGVKRKFVSRKSASNFRPH